MAEDPLGGAEDEFREMMRKFLAGEGDIDPSKLAGAAGLPTDPLRVARLMGQLQQAMNSTGEGINWQLARDEAGRIAAEGSLRPNQTQLDELRQALHLAALWLDEATSITQLTSEPSLTTRADWARLTLPVWTQLAEPVALSIADSLTEVTASLAEVKESLESAEEEALTQLLAQWQFIALLPLLAVGLGSIALLSVVGIGCGSACMAMKKDKSGGCCS